MRFLLLCPTLCIWLARALAREIPGTEHTEVASNKDNNVDYEKFDSEDGELPELPTENIPAVENLNNTLLSKDEGYESDWDYLEHKDEYAFKREARSVPRVPKNEKASDDIFYVQPHDIASYSPGDVIRMREVSPRSYPENVKAIYQYMVRSTDSLDQPVAIVSTIYISNEADGKRLLSFQVPTDSPCIDCAPSVDMRDSMKKLEKPLAYGWNVIAPDFQGLNAAFGAAKLAGQATLDAVRGALTTGNVTGISPEAQFGLWGYSGGSIATGWAAALQPRYAPELKEQLVGAAVGGWITNYDSTIKAADGNLAAGLVGLALCGLAQQYPELVLIYRKYIQNALRLRLVLESTTRVCLTTGVLRFLGARFFKGSNPYFKGGDKALNEPRVREIIEENMVAHHREMGMPECAFFLHHALKDNIAPVEDTRRAVYRYCKWDIESFEVNYVKKTGHMSESIKGAPAAVKWLKDRFDGYAPVKGCKEQTWETLLDYPGIDSTFFKRDDSEDEQPEEERENYGENIVRGILPLP